MPGFVRERGPHAALSHFALFGVERCTNDDCVNAISAKLCISQDSFWQNFVLRHNAKALLDEAIDTDGLGRIRIKPLLSEFIGANPVDLAWLKMGSLGE